MSTFGNLFHHWKYQNSLNSVILRVLVSQSSSDRLDETGKETGACGTGRYCVKYVSTYFSILYGTGFEFLECERMTDDDKITSILPDFWKIQSDTISKRRRDFGQILVTDRHQSKRYPRIFICILTQRWVFWHVFNAATQLTIVATVVCGLRETFTQRSTVASWEILKRFRAGRRLNPDASYDRNRKF